MGAGGSTEVLLTMYQPIGGSFDLITVALTDIESDEKNNEVQKR
jgi:hypothetical protein